MDVATLHHWAELLFDTGKRNSLIHFRGAKASSAEVLLPDFEALIRRADHGVCFEVFNPELESDTEELDFLPEQIPTRWRERARAEAAGEEAPPMSREEFLARYAKKVKARQLLVYNAAGKPLQALKTLSKRGRSAIEETGVNVLYLALGFICWQEAENPTQTLKAPLLLAPVSIENESALEPFRVRFTDSDIIVNPTFSFKLQNEFGVSLPEYDEDEEVTVYLDKVRALLSRMHWTLSLECRLGLFSFLKMNMYRDLKDNAARIVESPCVRAMMGESEIAHAEVPTQELHCVVDADSSQSQAIAMAKGGQSFVLQGPPGTGKSQTITNIIAECLHDGKKVLFVSEKQAALNVVYEKLKRAGLEEFCLELHSHKANKKQVIEELCETLKTEKSGVSERAYRELEAMAASKAQLDGYAEQIHTVQGDIERSLHQIYGELAACEPAPEIDFYIEDIENKGQPYIEEAEQLLRRYHEYAAVIGYDYTQNPWYGLRLPLPEGGTAQLQRRLREKTGLLRALHEADEVLQARYGIGSDNARRVARQKELLALLARARYLTPPMFSISGAERALAALSELYEKTEKAKECKAELDALFFSTVYTLNGEELLEQLLPFAERSLPGRVFGKPCKTALGALRKSLKKRKLFWGCGKATYAVALSAAGSLALYQECMQRVQEQKAALAPFLPDTTFPADFPFAAAIDELNALHTVLLDCPDVDYSRFAGMTQSELIAAQSGFAATHALLSAVPAPGELEAQLRGLSLFESAPDALGAHLGRCERCLAHLCEVDDWCEFARLLARLEALELRTFVDECLARGVESALLANGFKKLFYTRWADVVLHRFPQLLSLSRIPHDEAVRRFCEKDELSFEINKAKIRACVSAHRPALDMVARGSAVSVLLREGEKKRKQKSVRRLLAEIDELVQVLKPCMLMSPLSVSTFLSPDMVFDIVIFDEASQIFPQDAIGAIYRGKQLVVVGDSKQMPPSNFFHAAASEEDEEESESLSDFESILDLCRTTLPQCRLKWHYRSRYESLIAFSNRHFYDNELITFPSAMADAPGIGVDHYFVEGVFDRATKTNLKEAQRVVELVFAHIERTPERSLGVVAFSISQQVLIERLIARRRREDPTKDVFFKSDRPEPFFVKNLETVQGDERDTIIFSVAYGKGEDGRLLLNFGPLNREGGERRLNVAVTRAKCNVQLVTSMRHTDIDLNRTHSRGAALLRAYLAYAEGADRAEGEEGYHNAFDGADSFAFEGEVQRFLEERGYRIDVRVGRSALKTDIALRHSSGNYLLAVECDGDSYRAFQSTRDRDRLRRQVMERMGWRFYRIWSVDWVRNKEREQRLLLDAVGEALQNAPSAAPTPREVISFEETPKAPDAEFPTYLMFDDTLIDPTMDPDEIPVLICSMMEMEAPLSEEWLLKRLIPLYSRTGKITATAKARFAADVRRCAEMGVVCRDGFLYFRDREIPPLRVPNPALSALRDVRYIAPEELAGGLLTILQQNVSLQRSALFLLAVRLLGFSRVGETMHVQLEKALALLSAHFFVEGDDIITLKSEG